MELSIQQETIDAARAEELLGTNENNRRISRQYLNTLCAAHERGEWKFNGDTIRIDKTGNVLDGQHRLHMVARTGISIPAIVVLGLEPDVMDTIDVGKKRNFADLLSMDGHKNVHEVASALRKVDSVLNFGGNSAQRTLVEMEELLKQFSDVYSKVQYCRATPRHVMPVSAMAAAFMLFSRVNKAHASSFVNALMSGETDGKDAIHILREQLIRNKTGHTPYRTKTLMALTIDCWHFWRQKEKPVSKTFAVPSEFPEVIGIRLKEVK